MIWRPWEISGARNQSQQRISNSPSVYDWQTGGASSNDPTNENKDVEMGGDGMDSG